MKKAAILFLMTVIIYVLIGCTTKAPDNLPNITKGTSSDNTSGTDASGAQNAKDNNMAATGDNLDKLFTDSGSDHKVPELALEYQSGSKATYAYIPYNVSVYEVKNDAGTSALETKEEAHPLAMADKITKVDGKGLSQVRLMFSEPPKELVVQRWSDSDIGNVSAPYAEPKVTDGIVEVPKEGSGYIYLVAGKWDEGTVIYYFYIKK